MPVWWNLFVCCSLPLLGCAGHCCPVLARCPQIVSAGGAESGVDCVAGEEALASETFLFLHTFYLYKHQNMLRAMLHHPPPLLVLQVPHAGFSSASMLDPWS